MNSNGAPKTEDADQLLAHEDAAAKCEIQEALADLRASIKSAADLERWAAHHPWLTVGAATAGGFAAGSAVSAMLRPAPSPPTNGAPQPKVQIAEAKTTKEFSWLSAIFDLAKIAVQAAVTQAAKQTPNGNVPISSAASAPSVAPENGARSDLDQQTQPAGSSHEGD